MGSTLPKSSNLTSMINRKVIFPGAKTTQLEQLNFQEDINITEHCFNKKSISIAPKIIFSSTDTNQVDFLKISNQQSQKKSPKIIFFHGNAQNMHESLQLIKPIFRYLRFTTYIMEYPGYGCYKQIQSSIPERIRQDCLQFYELVKKCQNVRDQDVYIIGRSIGTGVASYLASKVNCKKLLLISPFDSIKLIANKIIGLNCLGRNESLDNFFFKDQFDNLESISHFKGKMMIIHGENDEVINISHAQNLLKKYHQTQLNEQNSLDSKFIRLPYIGHNDIQFEDIELLKKIEHFFIDNDQAML